MRILSNFYEDKFGWDAAEMLLRIINE